MRAVFAKSVTVLILVCATLWAQSPRKPQNPVRPKTPMAATFDSVEISVNGVTQKSRIHILDFADIPTGQTQTAKLQVHNLTDRQLVLDLFAWGDYVAATWHDTDQAVITRRLLPSHGSTEIEIELNCSDTSKQALQLVSLAENSVPVTTILVAYVAHPPTLVLPIVTGAYQSGLGAKWSVYYTVPSGPAPYGYKYLTDSFDTAGSDPAGNSRNCGFNVDCQKVQANDQDVIWQFKIQGYEHDWTHSDSSVKAEGHLTVVYQLKSPPAPTLKTVETR